jgi:hypothetical protein
LVHGPVKDRGFESFLALFSSISPTTSSPQINTNEPTPAMEKTDPVSKTEQEHVEHRESSPQLVLGEEEIDEAKV